MDKYDVLKNIFGYVEFSRIQEEIIDSILDKNNVFSILKTGGGKSLCFQIPALLNENLTIIVTPLISLMHDQVDALNKKFISAYALSSNVDYLKQKEIMNEVLNKKCKILYISPERLENINFMKFLDLIKIDLLVVDEAHTILYHQTFRKSFLKIKDLVKSKSLQIVCFTATANEVSLNMIKSALDIYNFKVIKGEFDRPEIKYLVYREIDKLSFVNKYIKNNKNGIIYCSTIKEVLFLKDNILSDNITIYHAKLDVSSKIKNQNDFISGRKKVMIATISFGMGIDKADIRFIINYNIPSSLDDLAQMIGRCSRDKLPGEHILLYSKRDIVVQNLFIDQIRGNIFDVFKIKTFKYNQLKQVIRYCNTKQCLHQFLANYFNESIKKCKNCSNCAKYLDK